MLYWKKIALFNLNLQMLRHVFFRSKTRQKYQNSEADDSATVLSSTTIRHFEPDTGLESDLCQKWQEADECWWSTWAE